MRGSRQGAGVVGAAPGLAMLVPWPARTVTRLPATETVTRPCSTNTPNTSLLGPAKKRVPRTAINPNVLRIRTVAGAGPRPDAHDLARTTLERFQAAGLSWPLTDVALEAELFAAAGTKQGHRRQIEPDYIQRELKRKHVTLSLLWERVH